MLFAVLMGCTSQLFVDYDQVGCQDYDYNNPAEEEIVATYTDSAITVSHANLIQTCDAVFEPVMTSDGSTLEIREYWTGGSADCETCITPQVIISDPPRRSIEVRWYVGDESIPLGVLEVQAE